MPGEETRVQLTTLQEDLITDSAAFLHYPHWAQAAGVSKNLLPQYVRRAEVEMNQRVAEMCKDSSTQDDLSCLTGNMVRRYITDVKAGNHHYPDTPDGRQIRLADMALRREMFLLGLQAAEHAREDKWQSLALSEMEKSFNSSANDIRNRLFLEGSKEVAVVKPMKDFQFTVAIDTKSRVYAGLSREYAQRGTQNFSGGNITSWINSFLDENFEKLRPSGSADPHLKELAKTAAGMGMTIGLIAKGECDLSAEVWEGNLAKEIKLWESDPRYREMVKPTDIVVANREILSLLLGKANAEVLDRILIPYGFFVAHEASDKPAFIATADPTIYISDDERVFLPHSRSSTLCYRKFFSPEVLEEMDTGGAWQRMESVLHGQTATFFHDRLLASLWSGEINLQDALKVRYAYTEGINKSDAEGRGSYLDHPHRSDWWGRLGNEAYYLGYLLETASDPDMTSAKAGKVVPLFERLCELETGKKDKETVQRFILANSGVIEEIYRLLNNPPFTENKITAASAVDTALQEYNLLCYPRDVRPDEIAEWSYNNKKWVLGVFAQDYQPSLHQTLMSLQPPDLAIPVPIPADRVLQAQQARLRNGLYNTFDTLITAYGNVDSNTTVSRESAAAFTQNPNLGILGGSWLRDNRVLDNVAARIMEKATAGGRNTAAVLMRTRQLQQAVNAGFTGGLRGENPVEKLLEEAKKQTGADQPYFYLLGSLIGLCQGRNFPRLQQIGQIISAMVPETGTPQPAVSAEIGRIAPALEIPLNAMQSVLRDACQLPADMEISFVSPQGDTKIRLGDSPLYQVYNALQGYLAEFNFGYLPENPVGQRLASFETSVPAERA